MKLLVLLAMSWSCCCCSSVQHGNCTCTCDGWLSCGIHALLAICCAIRDTIGRVVRAINSKLSGPPSSNTGQAEHRRKDSTVTINMEDTALGASAGEHDNTSLQQRSDDKSFSQTGNDENEQRRREPPREEQQSTPDIDENKQERSESPGQAPQSTPVIRGRSFHRGEVEDETSYGLRRRRVDTNDDGFRSTIRVYINPRTFWNLQDCKYKGDGTTLMVFGTGIDKSHSSFSSKSLLLPQEDGSYDDMDKNGHGTLCAGIACGAELEATLEDGIPIKVCGVAPNAKLGIWKACETFTKNRRSEFIAQLKSLTEYVQDKKLPIDVLVIPNGTSNPDTDMKKHIKTLDDMGIIIVCAASNRGLERNAIAYPARYNQTICIGSSTPYHEASDYSSIGNKMEFLGIGENIIGPKSKICERRERGGKRSLSEKSSEMFLTCNGTSFSASAVGGLICLILQTLRSNQKVLRIREELNREFIVELLKYLTNARGRRHDEQLGFGVIDGKSLKRFFKEPNDIIKEMRNDKRIVSL